MKSSQLATALLISICVYLAGTLLFGSYSDPALRDLEAYVARVQANVEDLASRQNRLVAQAELLRRSTDAVRVEARRLQYYREGEQVIRVENHTDREMVQSPGVVMRFTSVYPDHSRLIRIAAVAAFLLSLFLQIALDRHPSSTYSSMRRASR